MLQQPVEKLEACNPKENPQPDASATGDSKSLADASGCQIDRLLAPSLLNGIFTLP
jgi:hypothetical protein